MKIKSNDIDRVIEILQEFKGELKDQEYFEFKNKVLTKTSFEIPKKFAVQAINEENAKIIYPYTELKNKQGFKSSTSSHYNIYALLVYDGTNIKVIGNQTKLSNEYEVISPEDFIKHIVNENL